MSQGPDNDDEMRSEYDFSNAEQGKYARRFTGGSNIVVLDPEVAAAFPDSRTVNRALKALIKISQQIEARKPDSKASLAG